MFCSTFLAYPPRENLPFPITRRGHQEDYELKEFMFSGISVEMNSLFLNGNGTTRMDFHFPYREFTITSIYFLNPNSFSLNEVSLHSHKTATVRPLEGRHVEEHQIYEAVLETPVSVVSEKIYSLVFTSYANRGHCASIPRIKLWNDH